MESPRRTWRPASLLDQLWAGGTVIYEVPGRSPDEVAATIAGATARHRITTSEASFLGLAEGHVLRLRPRTAVTNAWCPVLEGNVAASGSGALLTGRFAVNLAGTMFGLLWLALAALALGLALLALMAAHGSDEHVVHAFLLAPGMVVLGGVFTSAGRLLARHQEEGMVAALDRLLEVPAEGRTTVGRPDTPAR
jgi:hypothetical protein